jgi:hypothetical protein
MTDEEIAAAREEVVERRSAMHAAQEVAVAFGSTATGVAALKVAFGSKDAPKEAPPPEPKEPAGD